MIRIEWSEPAALDLLHLREYISHDSSEYANRFVQKILNSIEQLASFPEIGRRVRESRDDAIREIIHKNYRIMYRTEQKRILVLAILHCGRDFENMEPKPWEIP